MAGALLVLNAGSSSLKVSVFADDGETPTWPTDGPCITHPGSRVAVRAIPTNEELMIARHTRDVLSHQK